MKTILFDYNGTLIKDDDINKEAWRATVAELSNGKLDFDEIVKGFVGVRNYSFVENIFKILGLKLDEEKIMYWAKRKETEYYHKLCTEKDRQLIEGAEEFLDYLKKNNIPFNMCTASLDVNVNYYFERYNLDKWFDRRLIVYDTGEYKDKKDMYLEAARRLGVSIKACLIFDDSPTSIKNAVEAGCENLIVIKKNNNPDLKEIKQRINNYKEIDYSLLE